MLIKSELNWKGKRIEETGKVFEKIKHNQTVIHKKYFRKLNVSFLDNFYHCPVDNYIHQVQV